MTAPVLTLETSLPAASARTAQAPLSGARDASTPAPDPGKSSEALLKTYKRAPMELTNGAGVYLFDGEGKRYLDFVSGIAVNALGYGDPGLVAAMHRAADGLIHVSNLYDSAPGRQLAEALVEKSFASKVFFCNSGAEANEGAFKFARRWGRTLGPAKHEIVALRGSFHGRLFGTLAATDRPGYRMPFRPLAGGITIVERDIEDLKHALDGDTVAALILEPVQGEGGVRVLQQDFVRSVRAITRDRQIALIFDEIQCGLGRTGNLFAYEGLGVTPDMVTLAKPIAGGLPMGAILVTDEIAATVQPGDHGTTFGGGPFIASVANYVLSRVSDPTLLEAVRENGAWLGQQLEEMAQRSGRVRGIRGIGYMWGIDVLGTAAEVVGHAREAGLLTCSAGDYTVRLLPPLVTTREELAEGLRILESVL